MYNYNIYQCLLLILIFVIVLNEKRMLLRRYTRHSKSSSTSWLRAPTLIRLKSIELQLLVIFLRHHYDNNDCDPINNLIRRQRCERILKLVVIYIFFKSYLSFSVSFSCYIEQAYVTQRKYTVQYMHFEVVFAA